MLVLKGNDVINLDNVFSFNLDIIRIGFYDSDGNGDSIYFETEEIAREKYHHIIESYGSKFKICEL